MTAIANPSPRPEGRARPLVPALLALAVLAAACGGGSGTPTTPPAPTPVPTPTPAPTPTPDPNVPPEGSACAKPYPPPISRFNVKIHLKEKDSWTVDATPLVGPDAEYCASIGFSDRTICPVRPEGEADRLPCELWRAGTAKDTSQPGPTWMFVNPDGTTSYCTGMDGPCDHHPNGPFTIKAIKGGRYRVCTEAGACSELDVDRGL